MTSAYGNSGGYAASDGSAYRSPGAAMPVVVGVHPVPERRRINWMIAIPAIAFVAGTALGASIALSLARTIAR